MQSRTEERIEFLKAVSKARLYGYESYKEAVNFIALNYPNSPEGKKAEEMMQNVMPSMANKEFIDNNDNNIYDNIGNLVEVLYNDVAKKGMFNRVEFDVSRHPSQMFIYKITTAGGIKVGKVVSAK